MVDISVEQQKKVFIKVVQVRDNNKGAVNGSTDIKSYGTYQDGVSNPPCSISHFKEKRMIDFRRKVTGKVNAKGRRFFAGDIVEKRDKEFLHYYINEDKDGIDLLVSPACNISGDNYEKLLDESEDI